MSKISLVASENPFSIRVLMRVQRRSIRRGEKGTCAQIAESVVWWLAGWGRYDWGKGRTMFLGPPPAWVLERAFSIAWELERAFSVFEFEDGWIRVNLEDESR